MMNNYKERAEKIRKCIKARAVTLKKHATKAGFKFQPFSRKQKQVLTWMLLPKWVKWYVRQQN